MSIARCKIQVYTNHAWQARNVFLKNTFSTPNFLAGVDLVGESSGAVPVKTEGVGMNLETCMVTYDLSNP